MYDHILNQLDGELIFKIVIIGALVLTVLAITVALLAKYGALKIDIQIRKKI